ncbi:hypothetical protein HAX54_023537 [Datura stramonium]|uniref:PDZ domain-containing protein n=1 Tax=Datura stramonium TaxID=4076 RepID=A0ABS8S7H0_DATST|nr:hypothetical protein [Datura stramonium]
MYHQPSASMPLSHCTDHQVDDEYKKADQNDSDMLKDLPRGKGWATEYVYQYSVENGGNAARAGLKVGDQVVYTSSFFGDELWPADKLGFYKTAIQAKPDSVYWAVSRGADVDVKRLPKRPAPQILEGTNSDAQKASLAYTHLLTRSTKNPTPLLGMCNRRTMHVHNAEHQRRGLQDMMLTFGKAIEEDCPNCVIIGLIAGIGGVGALLVYGLQ